MRFYMTPVFQQLKIISRLICIQILTVAGLSLFFGLWKGRLCAASAGIGGAIVILPELLFIAIYFRRTYARAARKVVNAFYIGEIAKLLFTTGLFTLAFQWSKLRPVPLFIVFIVTQMTFWLVPLIYEHNIRIHTTSSRALHRKNKLGNV